MENSHDVWEVGPLLHSMENSQDVWEVGALLTQYGEQSG